MEFECLCVDVRQVRAFGLVLRVIGLTRYGFLLYTGFFALLLL